MTIYGEHSASGDITMTGCTPYPSECIDESVPGGVNDADYIRDATPGPDALMLFLNPTLALHQLHAVEVLVRTRCETPGATGTLTLQAADWVGMGPSTFGPTTAVTVDDSLRNHTAVLRFGNTNTSVASYLELTMGACSSGAMVVTALSTRMTYSPLITDELLVPDGSSITGSTGALVGGCTPASNCLNQALGSGDGTYVETNSGCFSSQVATYGLSNPAYRAREVVSVRQAFRAQMENPIGSSTAKLQAAWSSPGGSTSNYSGAVNAGGAWQTREAAATSVSLTDAQIRSATLQLEAIYGSCVKERVADIRLKATYGRGNLVSGVARQSPGGGRWNGCDGTASIGIALDGTVVDHVSCDPTTGAYASSVVASQDSVVTVWLDHATVGNNGGSSHAKLLAASTDVTSFDVVRTEVRMRNTSTAALTATELDDDDVALGGQVPLTVAAGALTVGAGATLEVEQATLLTENRVVTTARLRVDPGATLDVQSGHRIDLTGSGTGACSAGTSARPFCATTSGSTVDALDVRYTGTATTDVDGYPDYHDLELRPASGAPTFRLGSGDDATLLVTGALVVGDGAQAVTASTTTWNPSVVVQGAATVNASATLSGSGSGSLTVAGHLTGAGLVNLTGGAVVLRSAGAATDLSATGASGWTFADLRLETSAGARAVTIPAASKSVAVTGRLTVGNAGDAATTSLAATAMTATLALRDLTNTTRGTVNAPPLMTVTRDVLNQGLFVPSGGGTTSIDQNSGGSGSLHDLEITADTTLELAVGVQVDHELAMTGSSCTHPARLRSSTPGVARTLANVGASASIAYGSFRDITALQAIANVQAGDLGGNTGITFDPTTTCGSLTAPRTNAAATPTNVDGRGTVSSSFTNGLGATADRFRTRVVSSRLNPSVTALYHFDTTGADRSDTNATAIASNGASFAGAAAAGFGSGAATFDGVDDLVQAPSNAAYDPTTWTVEAWFRTTTIANAAQPVVVSRGTSDTAFQFAIWFDRATGQLAGGTTHDGLPPPSNIAAISTPAAPWLDGTWHHVALTADAGKVLRLYVDGAPYGGTTSFAGANMTVPSAPISIGNQSFGDHAFSGSIDDVQLSNVALDAATIRGYARTHRPHAQVLWQSADYATDGEDLPSTCANATPCTPIDWSAASLHRNGARYYTYHSARAANSGFWTPVTTDWFETSDAISVSDPGTIPIPAGAAGTDTATSFPVTTSCGAPKGCELQLSAPSETIALATDASPASIPRIPSTTPAPWSPGDDDGLGFTVLSTTAPGGKLIGTWGAGTAPTDYGTLNYLGATRAATTLVDTAASGSFDTIISPRLNAPSATPPGAYAGTVELVAVPNL